MADGYDLVDAARGAEQVLGERAEGRVVADDDGESGRFGDDVAKRGVDPAEVRSVADESVVAADQARHGESDAEDAGVGQFARTPTVLRVAHEEGLAVPDDLSIIGFDAPRATTAVRRSG